MYKQQRDDRAARRAKEKEKEDIKRAKAESRKLKSN